MRLVRLIKQSRWTYVKDHYTNGKLTIKIEPRRFRMNDAIHVSLGDQEIWLPLIQRLRVRRFIRKLAIDKTIKGF